MRIAICDDIPEARGNIRDIILAYDDNNEIFEYTDGKELLEGEEHFDVIFLDIEMPEIDGMTAAKEIRRQEDDVQIVFMTSHDEMVYDAFEVRALNFLTKPVDEQKVRGILSTVEEELAREEQLVIVQKGKVSNIPLQKVVCFEAFGDGTYIYDKWNRVYESLDPLKVWEERMKGKGFYRVHRTHLVSLRYIRQIVNNRVLLEGWKKPIAVSKRKAADFKERYLDFLMDY